MIYYFKGDSGGPLVSFDKNGVATIRGIVSWAFGCAEPSAPGIFTRVGRYVNTFIRDNLI